MGVKGLNCLVFPMGRYSTLFIEGVGSGLQRGGSSMKFWSNGGGTRLLNL